jgi:endonuclease YncB( thermonuclease family)
VYEYAARAVRIIDGDTLCVDVDLGFNIRIQQHIRLLGINCAEHGTIAGDDATAYTKAWIAAHGPDLLLRTVKDRDDKYGRILGTVVANARILNNDLVEAGHAVDYTGGKRTLRALRGEPDPADPVR